MISELQEIRNPLLRAVVSGLGAGCILTIGAGLAITFGGLKGENNHRQVLAVLGAGTGIATIGGLFITQKSEDASQKTMVNPAREAKTAVWQDWRNLRVVRKVKESQEITSFYLQALDGGALPPYLPGQFLTIKLDIPDQARPIIRTYSLSDYQPEPKTYRLSIKRELAPKGLDVPPGLSSNFMHDHVNEGSIIPAKPPTGKFFLEVAKSIPIVLVSNGVGITPMIAMAKAVSIRNPQRQVWFFHGARDGSFHALREEMADLAKMNPNLHLHYAYSKPRPEDQGNFHSTGYVDMTLIQSLVKAEAEYFLCGSPAFMDSLRSGLMSANVPNDRIFFESFTKEKKASTKMETQTETIPEGIQVSFQRSHKAVAWKDDGVSLLELAENAGLSPDYSCR